MRFVHPDDLLHHVGAELGVSNWLEIDQARVNAFAKIAGTPESQWIYGYLLLSLFPRLTTECLDIGQVRRTLNYGLNRIRFSAPVPVGARVRLRQTISAAEKAKAGGIRLTLDGVLEVEHSEDPAVIGQTIRIVYP
jgi:acyl dehydratase